MSGSSSGAPQLAPRVKGSGVQKVYDALKLSILDLSLEPGAPLDEVTLAEAFGILAHELHREQHRGCLDFGVAQGLAALARGRGDQH